MELHARAQAELVGLRVLGDGPAFGEITNDLGIVGNVDAEQVGVVRRQQVDDAGTASIGGNRRSADRLS